MRDAIEALAREYDRLFRISHWVVGTGLGIFFVTVATTINYAAGIRATQLAGPPLHDVLLDVLPKLSTALVHTQAVKVVVALTLATLFLLPRYFPAALLGIALVTIVRAAFINMTHLGLYFDAEYIYHSYITFGGDLFFSGHVAIPVLLGLIFYEHSWVRNIFFALAFLLGAESLLGHKHYSIDVFAAPFIAYSLYALLGKLFPYSFKE